MHFNFYYVETFSCS